MPQRVGERGPDVETRIEAPDYLLLCVLGDEEQLRRAPVGGAARLLWRWVEAYAVRVLQAEIGVRRRHGTEAGQFQLVDAVAKAVGDE